MSNFDSIDYLQLTLYLTRNFKLFFTLGGANTSMPMLSLVIRTSHYVSIISIEIC